MFELYCNCPDRLPPHFQVRSQVVGIPLATGDFLAGMTDRFCDQQYQQLFGPK